MHVAQRFQHVENIEDINIQHCKFDSDPLFGTSRMGGGFLSKVL